MRRSRSAKRGSERIGSRQPLAIAQQREKAVRFGMGSSVRGGLGHILQHDGRSEASAGSADGGRLRVSKNDTRDRLVIGLRDLAENVRSGDFGLVFAQVSQGARKPSQEGSGSRRTSRQRPKVVWSETSLAFGGCRAGPASWTFTSVLGSPIPRHGRGYRPGCFAPARVRGFS
jgi:hypothetical protein